MEAYSQAKQLLEATIQFHTSLVQQARDIAKFRDILEFIVDCISFAETHFPPTAMSSWNEGQIFLNELSNRTQPIYGYSAPNPQDLIPYLNTSSGSMATGTFSMLTDNFRFLEDNESRAQFNQLAGRYKDLLSGPQEQDQVHQFLSPLNTTAQIKFTQSLRDFQSLPRDEDPQGPLLAMRSAIDLALNSLLKLTPLSKRERSDLKYVDLLPTIAHHLAKDELAKVDLILANDQFKKLKQQLSASKEIKIHRQQAEALMNQAVAVLHLIASTVKLPDDRKAEHANT